MKNKSTQPSRDSGPTRKSKTPTNSILSAIRSLLFGTLLLTALIQSAEAASYYVAKTGNDNNLGTQVAPWLTIQKAANTVAAGDTVNIAAGTYAGKVNISKSGTPSSRIIWTGTGTVAVGQLYVSGSYNTFTNFTVTGSEGMYTGCIEMPGTQTENVFSYFTYTGTATLTDGPGVVRAIYNPTNCTFDHFTVTQFNSHVVQLSGSGHTISDWIVTGTNGWDVFRMNFSNSTIRKCDVSVQNPGDANPNHSDIFQAFNDAGDTIAKNNIIELCHIHSCQGYQLGMVSDDKEDAAISNWTIQNNLFVDVERTFNIQAPYFKFLTNTFVRAGYSSGNTISVATTTKGNSNNTTIKNNLFYQCGYASQANSGGYIYDATTGLDFDNNAVVGTGAGTVKSWFTEVNGINGQNPIFTSLYPDKYVQQSGSPTSKMGVMTPPSNATTGISRL